MPEPYTTAKVTLGHVHQEEINVAYIPREDYLSLVRECIERTLREYGVDLTDELMPVAETMNRFPFNVWVHETRGCGCLVGEFLVAHDQVNRMQYVNEFGGSVDAMGNGVEYLLRMEYDKSTARALESLGGRIDTVLADFCYKRGCYFTEELDDWGDRKPVDSVIFLD